MSTHVFGKRPREDEDFSDAKRTPNMRRTAKRVRLVPISKNVRRRLTRAGLYAIVQYRRHHVNQSPTIHTASFTETHETEFQSLDHRSCFHRRPCIKMSLQEIKDDWQKPKVFSLSTCPHCNALRDRSEKTLCCMQGKRIITEQMFPTWPEYYKRMLSSIESVDEKSRELNNLCNFSSLGTVHAHETESTGFLYRDHVMSSGAQPVRVYALNGRTFHRIPVLGNGEDMCGTPFYYHHHPDPSAYVTLYDVRTVRKYMTEHNALAKKLSIISSIYYDNSDRREELQLIYVGQYNVHLAPEDQPRNTNESYVLHGTSVDYMVPPRLEGIALTCDDPERTLLSIPEKSHLWETTQYPFIYPAGSGGWFRSGHFSPLFKRSNFGGLSKCVSVLRDFFLGTRE